MRGIIDAAKDKIWAKYNTMIEYKCPIINIKYYKSIDSSDENINEVYKVYDDGTFYFRNFYNKDWILNRDRFLIFESSLSSTIKFIEVSEEYAENIVF